MNIDNFRKYQKRRHRKEVIKDIKKFKRLINWNMRLGYFSAKVDNYRTGSELIAIRFLLIRHPWLSVSNIRGNGDTFSWS